MSRIPLPIAMLVVVAVMSFPLVGQDRASDREAVAAGVGEPINGFPNWKERVLHQWINRARVDPQFEMARCGSACGEARCYSPQPPLAWSDALSRAARFHADEMAAQDYFAHGSRCTVVAAIGTMYPNSCNGAAACACVGAALGCGTAGCTRWYDRVALFGAGATGEILAFWSDPSQAFYLWLFEQSLSSACQNSTTNGHRWNILKLEGAAGAGMNENIAVVDFGRGVVPTGIVSAAHYPRSGTNIEIWANWYGSAAPRSAQAVVNGACVPMTLRRGTGTNGAWSATVSQQGSSCASYYVQFTAADGTTTTYPDRGSYAIGPPSCGDWSVARQSATCTTRSLRPRPVRR